MKECIIGCDPYKQDEESQSYGVTYNVKSNGTIELVEIWK